MFGGKKSRVAVLLSHYNGVRFLGEQVESIFNQMGVVVDLYIRDDGSTCKESIQLVKNIELENEHVSVIWGEHVGACMSFFSLLEFKHNAEYYAFSDQDDFWEPKKLKVAVDALSGRALFPMLYYSNLKVVDKSLRFLSMMHQARFSSTFEYLLFRNKCSGCTMVFNSRLKDIFLDIGRPKYTVMYDWWLILLAYCVGRVEYDPNALILYRQHDSNIVGMKHKVVDRWLKRFRRILFVEKDFFYARCWQMSALLRALETKNLGDKKKIFLLRRLVKAKSVFWLRPQLCGYYVCRMGGAGESLVVCVIILLGLY